jgi:hypothetical protein
VRKTIRFFLRRDFGDNLLRSSTVLILLWNGHQMLAQARRDRGIIASHGPSLGAYEANTAGIRRRLRLSWQRWAARRARHVRNQGASVVIVNKEMARH